MKQNAIVIFGGRSFEHDISIITALIVFRRATKSKFNLIPVYVNKNEEWFYFAGKDLQAAHFKNFDITHKADGFIKTTFDLTKKCLVVKKGIITKKIPVDVVLNCCHGGKGEDGGISALFECVNVPITSGDKTALGVCMDKVLSKYTFRGLSVPVIDFFDFNKQEYNTSKSKILHRANKLSYPLIVKPAMLGSSIGIGVAHNEEEFVKAVDLALEFSEKILVEKAILKDMKELNIACLKKDGKVLLSQIDTVKRSDEILSFKDKYIGDSECLKNGSKSKMQGVKRGSYISQEDKVFEDVKPKIRKQIGQITKKVYKKLNLSGVVRFDYILDEKNNVFLNEVNTIPGSLAYYFFVPSLFKNFSSFVDCLLDESIKNNSLRNDIKNEFVTNIF